MLVRGWIGARAMLREGVCMEELQEDRVYEGIVIVGDQRRLETSEIRESNIYP